MMAMPDSKRYLSELCLINPIPTGGWGGEGIGLKV